MGTCFSPFPLVFVVLPIFAVSADIETIESRRHFVIATRLYIQGVYRDAAFDADVLVRAGQAAGDFSFHVLYSFRRFAGYTADSVNLGWFSLHNAEVFPVLVK